MAGGKIAVNDIKNKIKRREVVQKHKYIAAKKKKAEKDKLKREIAAMPESERPAKKVASTIDANREKDDTVVGHDDEEVRCSFWGVGFYDSGFYRC